MQSDVCFPKRDGFWCPPEWERHERTWMMWPVAAQTCVWSDWPNGHVNACRAFAHAAHEISMFEPVTIIANAADVSFAQELCGAHIHVMQAAIDDSWFRDSGPTFLVSPTSNEVRAVRWIFDAYGNKFNHENDTKIAATICDYLVIFSYSAPFVMEGGAFDVDSTHTVVTTGQSVLHPNRNNGNARQPHEVTEIFEEFLGAEKTLLLPNGLPDDLDMDGHVDNVARFLPDGSLLVLTEANPQDSNYKALQENIQALRSARNSQGKEINIIHVPEPPRMESAKGGRLSLSPLNFYFVNNGVIVPTTGVFEEYDQKILSGFKKLFSNRIVRGVPSLDIVKGGGGIHCITQQQPHNRNRWPSHNFLAPAIPS